MKDPEFNPMELRRTLLDIDRHCDTVIGNLAALPASSAGRYAVGAVKALQKLASDGLKIQGANVSTPADAALKDADT